MKRITQAEILNQVLHEEGCDVMYDHISRKIKGVYIDEPEAPYIVINPQLKITEEVTTLAHEAGHHFTGLTGHTGRDEERADRWAANYLISPMATLKGARSYHDVAEMLHLPEQFIRNAIEILAIQYGQEIVLEQYRLHLLPVWVECKETGQVWPEG